MVKIVCWNLQRRQAAWRFLPGCDADIAVFGRRFLPPDDVAGRVEVDPPHLLDM